MDLVARGLPSPPPLPHPLSSSLTTSMKTSVTELSTWGSTRYPLIWRLHTICNLIGLFFHLNWEKDSQMRYIMQRWAATVLYLHIIQNFYNLSKPVSVWIELFGVWKLATMHITISFYILLISLWRARSFSMFWICAVERPGCMCVVIPMACATSPSASLVKLSLARLCNIFVNPPRCCRWCWSKVSPSKFLL